MVNILTRKNGKYLIRYLQKDIQDFDATTSSRSSSSNSFINYAANECREKSSDYEEELAYKVARRQKTCPFS